MRAFLTWLKVWIWAIATFVIAVMLAVVEATSLVEAFHLPPTVTRCLAVLVGIPVAILTGVRFRIERLNLQLDDLVAKWNLERALRFVANGPARIANGKLDLVVSLRGYQECQALMRWPVTAVRAEVVLGPGYQGGNFQLTALSPSKSKGSALRLQLEGKVPIEVDLSKVRWLSLNTVRVTSGSGDEEFPKLNTSGGPARGDWDALWPPLLIPISLE